MCGGSGNIYEHDDAAHYLRESEVVRRWWTLAPGALLPLSTGGHYELCFPGRPGGVAGPDVRDAVFRLPAASDGAEQVGDVEFHVRTSDWTAHGHERDPRYNAVILHVVLICDEQRPTLRQDGTSIPTCSLYDLPANYAAPVAWPCWQVMRAMDACERARLLQECGLQRFEQKAHAFVEALRGVAPHEHFSAYDMCLVPALAEGLGYGRDRAFFRASGLRLLGLEAQAPEPFGHAQEPPALDAKRLLCLRTLVGSWARVGAWRTLRAALETPLRAKDGSPMTAIHALRAVFTGLSVARADILICNVVLPFAAAVALIEDEAPLGELAQRIYLAYPRLPSNQVTRAMRAQLLLSEEPPGACQQQGLHYIYQETCRLKHCGICVAGKNTLL